ncbi:MAG: AAA family ATPase [Pseudomonadota bacterium]
MFPRQSQAKRESQATKPRRVIYLDGEMPGAALQSRVAALVENSEADFDPDNFKILTPDLQENTMPDISTIQGQEEIYPLVKDTDLIIIDNLSTLARSGGRENDAESWQIIAEWALSMRQEGRSVLFIHPPAVGVVNGDCTSFTKLVMSRNIAPARISTLNRFIERSRRTMK